MYELTLSYDIGAGVKDEDNIRYVITGAMYGIAAYSYIKLPNINIKEDQTENIVFMSNDESELCEIQDAIEEVLIYLSKKNRFDLCKAKDSNKRPAKNEIKYTLDILDTKQAAK